MSSEDPKSPSHEGNPEIDPEEFDPLQFLLDDPTNEFDTNNSPQEIVPQTSSAHVGSSNVNPAETFQQNLANPFVESGPNNSPQEILPQTSSANVGSSNLNPAAGQQQLAKPFEGFGQYNSSQQNTSTENSISDGNNDYSLSYIINKWMNSRCRSTSFNPIGENSNILEGNSSVEIGGGQSRNGGTLPPQVTINPPRKPEKSKGKLPALAPGLSWAFQPKKGKKKQMTLGTGKTSSSPNRKKKSETSDGLRGRSRCTTASGHDNLSAMNPAETSGKGKGISHPQQRSSFSRSQDNQNFHANPGNLEMLLDQEFQRLREIFGDMKKLPRAQQPSLQTPDPENPVPNQIPTSSSPESLDNLVSHGNSFFLDHDPTNTTQATGETSSNIPISTDLPLDSVNSVAAEAPVGIENSNNIVAAETLVTETDNVPSLEDQKEETERDSKSLGSERGV